jgi:hypothetical protein
MASSMSGRECTAQAGIEHLDGLLFLDRVEQRR